MAVSNILGQGNVEHLLSILKTGSQTLSIKETSSGDSIVAQQKDTVMKTIDLSQSYMRLLIEQIPSMNHKTKEAHLTIQRMIQRSITQATENLNNFVRGCYDYHHDVRIAVLTLNR
jgi:hypothetical protein